MEVVVNGTFTIDAAAQLSGKPSMMNPETSSPINSQEGEVNDSFKKQLKGLLDPYIALKDALVRTDSKQTASSAAEFLESLKKIDRSFLNEKLQDKWSQQYDIMAESAASAIMSTDVEAQRSLFSQLSNAFYESITDFQITGLHAYYQFCPMAFNDDGGYWISKEKEIKNPYFGSRMMRCGETIRELK
jgi:Cu(I)/Ag(I) efflux system membrane fusion protein